MIKFRQVLSPLVGKRSGKSGRDRVELPRADIIQGYEEGLSTWALAKKHHVAQTTILNRLREWEVELRPPGWKLGRPRNVLKAETGNRESNPGEGGAESNPGVSESPPSSIDVRRRQILELEAKIVAGDLTLKLAHERKQAYEKELAIIKGVPAR